MRKKYTSLDLSKKLAENGFKIDTDRKWWYEDEEWVLKVTSDYVGKHIRDRMYPAYHFFDLIAVNNYEFFTNPDVAPFNILGTIINKGYSKEDAEEYIWMHCVHNPEAIKN